MGLPPQTQRPFAKLDGGMAALLPDATIQIHLRGLHQDIRQVLAYCRQMIDAYGVTVVQSQAKVRK